MFGKLGLSIVICVGLVAPVWAQEPPVLGDFDPSTLEGIVIEDYPILPELTDNARQIFEARAAAGEVLPTFAKIGDCMTNSAYFFAPFGLGEYDLGAYEELQRVIDLFSATPVLETFSSFENPSVASANGFNTASVLDPIWADPQFCSADESPLACEYRITNPVFSFIMFGTNDVVFIPEDSFDFYLRTIVIETIANQTIPVLSTFPNRPEFPEQVITYNQIVIRIAQDYDLPLVNLWLSIRDLENEGVDKLEPSHLSIPTDEQTGLLTEAGLEWGYNVRNLIMLQTLDRLWTELNP